MDNTNGNTQEQDLKAALIRAEQRANAMPRTLPEILLYAEQVELASRAEARRKKEAEKAAAEAKVRAAAEHKERVRAWWLATKGAELTDGAWARNEAAIIAEYERATHAANVAAKRREFPGSI